MANLSLKQKKNEEKLLDSLSASAGVAITHLDIEHMSKEEYFHHQMNR